MTDNPSCHRCTYIYIYVYIYIYRYIHTCTCIFFCIASLNFCRFDKESYYEFSKILEIRREVPAVGLRTEAAPGNAKISSPCRAQSLAFSGFPGFRGFGGVGCAPWPAGIG